MVAFLGELDYRFDIFPRLARLKADLIASAAGYYERARLAQAALDPDGNTLTDVDYWEFWRRNCLICPCWFEAVKHR